MATLPQSVGFQTPIEYVSEPSLTWIINRDTMTVQSMDEGLEAVRQAVDIILNTERFFWQIYSSNMGAELTGLIGETDDYIESELPRRVTEALLIDDRIIDVRDFAHTQNYDSMLWTFTVETVFGSYQGGINL